MGEDKLCKFCGDSHNAPPHGVVEILWSLPNADHPAHREGVSLPCRKRSGPRGPSRYPPTERGALCVMSCLLPIIAAMKPMSSMSTRRRIGVSLSTCASRVSIVPIVHTCTLLPRVMMRSRVGR